MDTSASRRIVRFKAYELVSHNTRPCFERSHALTGNGSTSEAKLTIAGDDTPQDVPSCTNLRCNFARAKRSFSTRDFRHRSQRRSLRPLISSGLVQRKTCLICVASGTRYDCDISTFILRFTDHGQISDLNQARVRVLESMLQGTNQSLSERSERLTRERTYVHQRLEAMRDQHGRLDERLSQLQDELAKTAHVPEVSRHHRFSLDPGLPFVAASTLHLEHHSKSWCFGGQWKGSQLAQGAGTNCPRAARSAAEHAVASCSAEST